MCRRSGGSSESLRRHRPASSRRRMFRNRGSATRPSARRYGSAPSARFNHSHSMKPMQPHEAGCPGRNLNRRSYRQIRRTRPTSVDVSSDSPHEKYEYIRTPTEPQKMSGASIIPATIIFVTAKLRAPPRMPKQPIASMASCYGHEVRDGSDLGLSFARAPTSAGLNSPRALGGGKSRSRWRARR